VQLSITTATGYDHATVSGEVTTALQNYVNTLPLGRPLNVTRLAQIAYDTSPGVTNVNGILVNGATVDLAVTPSQVIKAGLVTVN
jgi:hypothetical protein